MQETLAGAQSAVLSVAFLVFVFSLPKIVRWYLDCQAAVAAALVGEAERRRDHEAAERKLDREARHATATMYQTTVMSVSAAHRESEKELVQAIHDLRMAATAICKWREP